MKTNEAIREYSLYTLKLQHGKYYVGTTSQDPHVRIKEHGSYKGARWTRLHKPVATLQIKKLGRITQSRARAIEHKVTLRYIDKFGYQNVRGGYLNYAGLILPITKHHFINGYQLRSLGTGLLLIWLSLYVLTHV